MLRSSGWCAHRSYDFLAGIAPELRVISFLPKVISATGRARNLSPHVALGGASITHDVNLVLNLVSILGLDGVDFMQDSTAVYNSGVSFPLPMRSSNCFMVMLAFA